MVRVHDKVDQQSGPRFAAVEPELTRTDTDKSNRFATLSMFEEKHIASSRRIEQIEPIVTLTTVAERGTELIATLLPGS
jgi:hypothetical protein